MRQKALIISILILSLIVNQGMCRNGITPPIDTFVDWEGNGFRTIRVTAYCVGHHTSMGVPVQTGIIATSPEHHGQVAELWTLSGNFLGYYYCCDSGGTDAIRQGYVVDVYRSNLTQCKNFMRITGGKVKIRFIDGCG